MSTTDDLPAPATRLKWVRRQLGKSQREVADLLGLSLTGYQNYEQGGREVPVSLGRLIKTSLGVSPPWIFSGNGHPWIDEAHTPEHLRIAPDEVARVLRARERIETILEDYPALKSFELVRTALINVAGVEGIESDHLYLLASAFDAVLKKVKAEGGTMQTFNAAVEQVGGRDIINTGKKRRP